MTRQRCHLLPDGASASLSDYRHICNASLGASLLPNGCDVLEHSTHALWSAVRTARDLALVLFRFVGILLLKAVCSRLVLMFTRVCGLFVVEWLWLKGLCGLQSVYHRLCLCVCLSGYVSVCLPQRVGLCVSICMYVNLSRRLNISHVALLQEEALKALRITAD